MSVLQMHVTRHNLIYIIKIGRFVCGQRCDWSARSAGLACAQRRPVTVFKLRSFSACNIHYFTDGKWQYAGSKTWLILLKKSSSSLLDVQQNRMTCIMAINSISCCYCQGQSKIFSVAKIAELLRSSQRHSRQYKIRKWLSKKKYF